MCLLKVYLEDGNRDRKLIAEDIALISKEDNGVKIRNLNFEEETLEDVDIVMINL
ncbi:CooT family nickel-binding protein [Candidatus Bathyarchaeota archaeon]|nr:CooT family nickel-binding protein [Candidatus Bathyarchaeota archaeon]